MDIGVMKQRSKAIRSIAIHNMTIRSFDNVIDNIESDVMYNILTQKSISPFGFLLYLIKKYGKIEECNIATYRVSYQALLNFKELLDSDKIGSLHMILNDNYKTLMRDKANYLTYLNNESVSFSYNIKNAHAKVTTCKCGDKYIVMQGSGNYSTNPKIEQYTIIENKELYDFYKEWMTDGG